MREGKQLEYKENLDSNTYMKTISAFANYEGENQSFEEITARNQDLTFNKLEQVLQMFRRYYQYEKIEGTERNVVDKIPEKAFREAIANALVHRMWDVKASIKVSMYSDRIEINSPGGLPEGINEEEYLNGQISILRNPIIGNVFFRLKYIEKFGTGTN